MSASNDNLALELANFISHCPGKRVCGRDVKKEFAKKYPLYEVAFSSLKPKKLCEDYPNILTWVADPDAAGCGWVCSIGKKGHSIMVAGGGGAHQSSGKRGSRAPSIMVAGGGGASSLVPSSVHQSIMVPVTKLPPSSVISVDRMRSGSTTQVVQVTTTTTNEQVVEAVRPQYDMFFVLDVSGSMSGSPAKAMHQAVTDVIGSLVPKKDRFAITVFNNTLTTLVPLKKVRASNVDVPCFDCSGSTALYDSIVESLRTVASRDDGEAGIPSHPHIVVVTDGEDVSSRSHNLNSVIEILKKPGDFCRSQSLDGRKFSNFHASFITVGRDTDPHYKAIAKIIRDCGKTNLHHFNAASAADISACFREVKNVITVSRSSIVTTAISMGSTSAGARGHTAASANGSHRRQEDVFGVFGRLKVSNRSH